MHHEQSSSSTDDRVVYSIIILAFYLFGQFGGRYLYPYYSHLLVDLPAITHQVIWSFTYFGLVPVTGAILLFGYSGIWSRLGLDKGFFAGLWPALLISLPMFLGCAWLSDFTISIDWESDIIFGSITAPFFEEFFFRAFLFGLLYRYAGWNLWTATLLDGLVFGAIHVSQGESLLTSASVFAVTGLGAVGFSILYKEWGWNLWLVIFIHAFMNLSWMMFDVANNAAGGLGANLARGTTILVAVVWTVLKVRKRNRALPPVQHSGAKSTVGEKGLYPSLG